MQGKMRHDLYQELFRVENQHWWHLHKRLVIHQFIEKYVTRGRVLDVGAGTGKILSELKLKGWQVIGVDGEKEAIFFSKKRDVPVKLVDLEKGKLLFKRNHFDLVLVLDILEHLKDDGGILKEIKRVIKVNGLVLITVPAYCWLFSYWDKMLGHQRRYSKTLLEKKLKKAGLEVIYLGYFFSLFLFPALLVRLVKTFLGNKKHQVSDFQTTPFRSISLPIIKVYGKIERELLHFLKLPFGLSILCVAQKAE